MNKQLIELTKIVDPNFYKGHFSLRDFRRTKRALAESRITQEELMQKNRALAEVITAADIGPQADVLDRRVIAAFRDYLTGKPQRDVSRIFAKHPLTDTRDFKDILYSEVGNYTEKKAQSGYDATYINVSQATYSMEYYGRLLNVAAQAWRQDRENILAKIPELLAQAGRRTLMRLAVNCIWNNRNTTYTAARGNRFYHTLTQTNLETVLQAMALLTETVSGEPRGTVMAYLVVPVTLEQTARRLLKPIKDTLALASLAGNMVEYDLDYIATPMLDTYTTSGWFLFAEPQGDQGPLADAFVRGREEPEILMKAADAQYLSGGMDEGSFDLETLSWKGRLMHNLHTVDDLYWMTAYSDPTS